MRRPRTGVRAVTSLLSGRTGFQAVAVRPGDGFLRTGLVHSKRRPHRPVVQRVSLWARKEGDAGYGSFGRVGTKGVRSSRWFSANSVTSGATAGL